MYDIQSEFLNFTINKEWMYENSKMAIIGGIIINDKNNDTDKFLPIKFEIHIRGHKKVFY